MLSKLFLAAIAVLYFSRAKSTRSVRRYICPRDSLMQASKYGSELGAWLCCSMHCRSKISAESKSPCCKCRSASCLIAINSPPEFGPLTIRLVSNDKLRNRGNRSLRRPADSSSSQIFSVKNKSSEGSDSRGQSQPQPQAQLSHRFQAYQFP